MVTFAIILSSVGQKLIGRNNWFPFESLTYSTYMGKNTETMTEIQTELLY